MSRIARHIPLAGIFLRRNGPHFGMSTQTTSYQQEMVNRLHVPFEVLSDEHLRFTRAEAADVCRCRDGVAQAIDLGSL
jgi:peroxiredoxin